MGVPQKLQHLDLALDLFVHARQRLDLRSVQYLYRYLVSRDFMLGHYRIGKKRTM